MPQDVAGVMHEFKHGELHSGSKHGPKVTNRKQAIAIALSEQRQQGKSTPRRGKSTRAARTDDGKYDGDPAPPGFGGLKHRPRNFPNPGSLAARRTASRQRYQ